MTSHLPSPGPSPLLSVAPVDQTNPLLKAAITFWLCEVFIMYSRLFDSIAGGLHIPFLVLCCLIVTSLTSGKLFRGLSSKIGRGMMAFLCWVSLTVVFSIWRSGSIPKYEYLLSSMLAFLVASGLLSSVRHVYRTLYTLAISSLVAAVLGFYFGSSYTGRLEIGTGSYKDANEYAMCLLMGVPFWLLMAASKRSVVFKIIAMVSLLPIFWAFFNTGSRGGLVGLGALLIMFLVQASFTKKLLIVAATGLGLMLVSAVIPHYLKARYLSTFTGDSASTPMSVSEQQYLESDLSSAEGRKDMLRKSIAVTLENPIFGVGPGNFPLAVFVEAKKNGAKYSWVVTHNSYTEISSETGIPGLILFLLVMIYSYRQIYAIYRLTGPRGLFPWPEVFTCTTYLMGSMTAVMVCMFFLSAGFEPAMYIFAGIVVSLRRIVDNEMSARPVQVDARRPAPGNPFLTPQVSGFPRAGFPRAEFPSGPAGRPLHKGFRSR